MSDLIVFGIGLLIFFITVYGVVMAGGFRLTRRYVRDNRALIDLAPNHDVDATSWSDRPTNPASAGR